MLTIILALLVNPVYAREPSLSELKTIRAVAQEYGIDSQDLLTIAYVESSFRQNAKHVNADTIDIGMFQVNSTHWDTTCEDLDVFKLRGNAECAARLILQHRTNADTDPHWLARYHSKTPSLKSAYWNRLVKGFTLTKRYADNFRQVSVKTHR